MFETVQGWKASQAESNQRRFEFHGILSQTHGFRHLSLLDGCLASFNETIFIRSRPGSMMPWPASARNWRKSKVEDSTWEIISLNWLKICFILNRVWPEFRWCRGGWLMMMGCLAAIIRQWRVSLTTFTTEVTYLSYGMCTKLLIQQLEGGNIVWSGSISNCHDIW